MSDCKNYWDKKIKPNDVVSGKYYTYDGVLGGNKRLYMKELLNTGTADTLSIDGIGAQSGFSSRSSFYASFKAETGMTPSQYLESL